MAVYFIQCGQDGPIKIGTAISPDMRLIALQGGHWQQLTLLAWHEGGRDAELALHARFQHLLIRGEWFAPTRELMDHIASVKPSAQSASESCDPLLPEIERYLIDQQIAATEFGRRVLGDPTLVHELRRGRECKIATRERIRAFMAAQAA